MGGGEGLERGTRRGHFDCWPLYERAELEEEWRRKFRELPDWLRLSVEMQRMAHVVQMQRMAHVVQMQRMAHVVQMQHMAHMRLV